MPSSTQAGISLDKSGLATVCIEIIEVTAVVVVEVGVHYFFGRVGGWVGVLDENKAIVSPAGAWLWAELGNKGVSDRDLKNFLFVRIHCRNKTSWG